ncbi:hypothetical protein [Stappia phage SI01]|uniref:Uncharacterized protein n=1 Tax=Stappia phage SI01 TaxID=2847766 RepID=A0AAE7SN85_9CAUD|nr:hypothetical protein [Stappia phage SI01]
MLYFITTAYGLAKSRLVQIAAAVAAVLGALLYAYSAGKRHARVENYRKTVQNLKTKAEIDDEINRLSPADRRRALSEWMPDRNE